MPQHTSPAKTPDSLQYPSQPIALPIPRNTHLDRLYNVKSPDPPSTENPFPVLRKPSVPTYQNDLILPATNKTKAQGSPVIVTAREKIDGNTKLSLEDVGLIDACVVINTFVFFPVCLRSTKSC